jgi:hypothetical protein
MARTPRTPPGTGNSWGRLSSLSDLAGSQARRPDPRRSTAKKPQPRGRSWSVHNREIRAKHQAAPSKRLDPFEGVTSKKRPASAVRTGYKKKVINHEGHQEHQGSQECFKKHNWTQKSPFVYFVSFVVPCLPVLRAFVIQSFGNGRQRGIDKSPLSRYNPSPRPPTAVRSLLGNLETKPLAISL